MIVNLKKKYSNLELLKYWMVSIIIFSIFVLLIQFICCNDENYYDLKAAIINKEILDSITPNYPPPLLMNFLE
jgi:hypothetical protein